MIPKKNESKKEIKDLIMKYYEEVGKKTKAWLRIEGKRL